VSGTASLRGLIGKLRSEFSFIAGNFAIMMVSWLVLDFASELPSTYYPLYIQALGGTASTIGLIGAVEGISRGIVQIPGGYLADKYGRKWLIASMTFVAAFARLLYIFAPSWEWILVGALLVGVTNIYGPALMAIVADSTPKEKRGMAFSIITLINSVSTTPAPLLAGFLYARMGLIPSMRLGYGITLVGFLIAAFLRLRLKETVEKPAKFQASEVVATIPLSIKESFGVWKLLPRTAFIFFISQIISSFAIGLFQPVITLYAVNDLGIDPVSFSYIMTVMFVTMIAVAIPSGKLIDKVGRKIPLVISCVLAIVFVPLLIYGDFWRLILAMTMAGLLIVLINAAGNTLFADLIPKEYRGVANGAMGFWSMLVMSAGQIAGGWLYDNVNHQLPFWGEAVMMIPSLLLIVFFVKEPEKRED
jgi:MFS transporter, DHA1 family, multidrug resistance protein